MISQRPLCVDLDGTLIRSDTLWESVVLLLRRQPWRLFSCLFWLCRGKAFFKRAIAARVQPDAATLPYRPDVLEFLRMEKQSGRRLVLATGTATQVAQAVAQHLDLFSEVIATDGTRNIVGHEKLRVLKERFGDKGFDYVGNSRTDLQICRAAANCILVSPSQRLVEQAADGGVVQRTFGAEVDGLHPLFRVLRPEQSIKNLLVFLPLLLSHKAGQLDLLWHTIIGFFAFSLCASGGYVLNDLLDIQADRLHPRKKQRPFAGGTLSIPVGIVLVAVFIGSGLLLSALCLSGGFLLALICYTVITKLYSFYLKSLAVLDVIVLAGLYSTRLWAGSAAANVPISPWLMALSIFFFLSLAFLKRFTEIYTTESEGHHDLANRGYSRRDRELLASVGVASGYLAVLVMALYINNSPEVTLLYRRPMVLWFVCPLLLYWITRLWLRAHRRELLDDPILVAVQDPASWIVGACVIAVALAAS
jgi:4-hydroxybenzoate polyprenyltransferase/phosphoserine phosphatase